MSRFYVPKDNIKGDKIFINGKEAHHILDVMRLKEKSDIIVFDSNGTEYKGVIKSIDKKKKKLIVEIASPRNDGPTLRDSLNVTLAQAIPKKDRMDYVVEKTAELGVKRIIPLITERTIVRPDKTSSGKKVERWNKKAIEAAKQCGRIDIPMISDITEYKIVVDSINSYDLALFACLSSKTISLKEALKDFKSGKVLILIGPEGDFTSSEIEMARRANCKLISLGSNVLRSDTAGLFVLSVLNYIWGRSSDISRTGPRTGPT